MKFITKLIRKTVIISVIGEMTSTDESNELTEIIQTKIAKGNKSFIVDLEGVHYVNSAGINILITALTAIRNQGGEMILASISDKVSNVLVITKLNSIFKVQSSVEEALQIMNKSEVLETDRANKPI